MTGNIAVLVKSHFSQEFCMSICSNPSERKIKIREGDGAVILVLRDYSTAEYGAYMKSRFKMKKGGQVEDCSFDARIQFVDHLLIGIEGVDAHGQHTDVTYRDPAIGEEKKLGPQVERWQQFVNPKWKFAAAVELEAGDAETANDILKN